MNELVIMKNQQLYKFENNRVRMVVIDDQPYFVGKDVAKALGYKKTRNALSVHVDNEDKKGALIQGDLGGKQEMTVINESGLYSLILSSKLPKAKKFKRWVTSEVLPAIRTKGAYITDELLENTESLKELIVELKAERTERLKLQKSVDDLKALVVSNGSTTNYPYTAKRIADSLGVTPQMIGKWANNLHLRDQADYMIYNYNLNKWLYTQKAFDDLKLYFEILVRTGAPLY